MFTISRIVQLSALAIVVRAQLPGFSAFYISQEAGGDPLALDQQTVPSTTNSWSLTSPGPVASPGGSGMELDVTANLNTITVDLATNPGASPTFTEQFYLRFTESDILSASVTSPPSLPSSVTFEVVPPMTLINALDPSGTVNITIEFVTGAVLLTYQTGEEAFPSSIVIDVQTNLTTTTTTTTAPPPDTTTTTTTAPPPDTTTTTTTAPPPDTTTTTTTAPPPDTTTTTTTAPPPDTTTTTTTAPPPDTTTTTTTAPPPDTTTTTTTAPPPDTTTTTTTAPPPDTTTTTTTAPPPDTTTTAAPPPATSSPTSSPTRTEPVQPPIRPLASSFPGQMWDFKPGSGKGGGRRQRGLMAH